jgi:mRNA-degrading endonuclease toxin of MazEF toxin-antitoxin module
MPATILTTDEPTTLAQQIICDKIISGEATTTDATVTTIVTIPTEFNRVYGMWINLTARRTNLAAAGWHRLRTAVCRNEAGVVTVDSTTIIATDGIALNSGIAVSGTNIILTVTGANLVTLKWKCFAQMNAI